MKKFINKWWERVRRFSENHGFDCDYCGKELFEYPRKRLCRDCERSLYPVGDRVCAKCGRETRAEGICLDCKAQARAFTQGFAPFVYLGETAAFINCMKENKPRLSVYCGEKMSAYFVEKYPSDLPKTDADEPFLILPVPITAKKKWERGYNQSEQLARAVFNDFQKRGIAAEMDFDVLRKTRDNAAQKQMSSKERAQNIQGAYHVHKRKACRDRTILLIDDILTTGATSGECAERLLGAGAKEVHVLVFVALPERE